MVRIGLSANLPDASRSMLDLSAPSGLCRGRRNTFIILRLGNHGLSDRVEYWWIRQEAGIQPAEVTFRGGIPIHARLIGTQETLAAISFELMERLPAAPRPVLEQAAPPAPRTPADRSGRIVWLVGIILLTLIVLFSGRLFDALK